MNRKAKQKEGRRTIGRRTLLLGSGMILVTSFLSGRLYQLQAVSYSHLTLPTLCSE